MALKKCPFCVEEIQEEAKICRYCKSNLETLTQQTPTTTSETLPLSNSQKNISVMANAAPMPHNDAEQYDMSMIVSYYGKHHDVNVIIEDESVSFHENFDGLMSKKTEDHTFAYNDITSISTVKKIQKSRAIIAIMCFLCFFFVVTIFVGFYHLWLGTFYFIRITDKTGIQIDIEANNKKAAEDLVIKIRNKMRR